MGKNNGQSLQVLRHGSTCKIPLGIRTTICRDVKGPQGGRKTILFAGTKVAVVGLASPNTPQPIQVQVITGQDSPPGRIEWVSPEDVDRGAFKVLVPKVEEVVK